MVVGVEIWGIGTEPNGTFTEYPTTITNLTYTHEVVTEPEPEPEPVFGNSSIDTAYGTWDTTEEEIGTLVFDTSDQYYNRIYFTDETCGLNENQTVSGIFDFREVADPDITIAQAIYKGFVFTRYDANNGVIERIFYSITYKDASDSFSLYAVPYLWGTVVWEGYHETEIAASGSELYNKLVSETGVKFEITLTHTGEFIVRIDGSAVQLPENMDTFTFWSADFSSSNVVVGVEIWGLGNGQGLTDCSTPIREITYTHSESGSAFGSVAEFTHQGTWVIDGSDVKYVQIDAVAADNGRLYLREAAQAGETQTISAHISFSETADVNARKGFSFSYKSGGSEYRVFYAICFQNGELVVQRIAEKDGVVVWDNSTVYTYTSGTETYAKIMGEGVIFSVTRSADGTFSVSIDGSAVEMAANTNTVTENGADYANNACTVGIEIWTSYGAGNGSVFGGVTYTHE